MRRLWQILRARRETRRAVAMWDQLDHEEGQLMTDLEDALHRTAVGKHRDDRYVATLPLLFAALLVGIAIGLALAIWTEVR